LRILYFAWLREKTGISAETCTPPADVTTVSALMNWLSSRSPAHAAAFAQRNLIRCAVDQEFATPEKLIDGAQEIGFFPPVTGG
jgi:molybdopterin synthase sulfur carrier subunit